jgi:hypothetical protein
MPVKLRIILVALVIGLAGFAAPAAAQRGRGGSAGGSYGPLGVASSGTDTAGNKYQDYLYGIVKELNKDAMVLTGTKAGTDQTFKFNKKTKFIHDGKDSSLKSLQLGDKVWVDVDEDKKTGDLIARKVVTGVFLMPSN